MNSIQGAPNVPNKLNNASTILKSLSFPSLKLNTTEKDDWAGIFFDSIITEYDARRLYWYIANDNPDGFSKLKDILNRWLRDEIDHAYGFSLIYSAYTGTPLDEVALKVEIRQSDFNSLIPFMRDPFSLLILLAYDEIITTHVYHRSIQKYDNFNSPQLSAWIRKTKRDEAKHFFLFVEKAKQLFSDRLHEAPSILQELHQLDFEKKQYTGTFVLDHNTLDYPINRKEIENTIIPTILKKLNESPRLLGGANK